MAENVTLLCKSIKIEKKIIITRFSALSTRQERLSGVLIFKQILLTTMLTIKILFTINSIEKKKKTINSKHYLQLLSISKALNLA